MNQKQDQLYYSSICPDTVSFIECLKEHHHEVEEIDIHASMKNLKAFLAIRDSRTEYETVKANGLIGIPMLFTREQHIILKQEELEHYLEASL